jgi:hypothetical protein
MPAPHAEAVTAWGPRAGTVAFAEAEVEAVAWTPRAGTLAFAEAAEVEAVSRAPRAGRPVARATQTARRGPRAGTVAFAEAAEVEAVARGPRAGMLAIVQAEAKAAERRGRKAGRLVFARAMQGPRAGTVAFGEAEAEAAAMARAARARTLWAGPPTAVPRMRTLAIVQAEGAVPGGPRAGTLACAGAGAEAAAVAGPPRVGTLAMVQAEAGLAAVAPARSPVTWASRTGQARPEAPRAPTLRAVAAASAELVPRAQMAPGVAVLQAEPTAAREALASTPSQLASMRADPAGAGGRRAATAAATPWTAKSSTGGVEADIRSCSHQRRGSVRSRGPDTAR